MPKKPTSRRLDDLFEGIQDEQAKPPDKTKRKTSTRTGEKKPALSSTHPAATKPAVRASALSQTKALPPLESVSVAQRGGAGTPSSLSLAFQMDSRNWATLQVVDDEAVARDWDPDEQLLVKQVVDQLSQALESARLFQETRSRAEELSVLNEMGRELTTLFSVEAIAETIYKYASRLMDTTNLFVTLYDETKQEITPFYVISNRERITIPARQLGNSLTDYVLRTRKPLFIPENLLTRVKELGIDVVKFGNNNNLAQCWMGAPLLVGETVLGTVGVQNLDSPNIFTERHRDLLTAISSQAAIAIQNARLFEETQRRTKELDALNQLNQRLSAQLNVDQVLQEIYHGVENLIDAKNFYVSFYSPEKNEVTFPLNVSESVIDKTIITLPADKGLTGYVLRARKPILIPENVTEAMYKLGIEVVGEPTKCWLGVPLLLGEQVIGVMAAQSYTEANFYDEHDRDLLMAVAGQAAISIQNARLFGETQRRVTELSTFNEISRELAAALLRPEELYRLVHQQMSRLFDTTSFFIGTYEAGSDHWEMAYRVENGQPAELGPRDLKAGLGSYMVRTRQPLLIHSAQELEDFHHSQGIPQLGLAGAKSWMGVPLIATGQVVGVMAIQNYQQENLFSNQDLALFSTIAAQVAIALQNARLFQDTERRAEEMATLNDLGRALSSQLNLNQVLDEVHKGVSRILDTANFYIAIYDEPSHEIIFPYNVSESQVDREITRLPIDQGLTSYLIRTRESILLKGEANEWLASHGIESVGEPSLCWLGVPLLIGEKTLGAIAVQSYTNPEAFSEHDRYLLTAISNQAAIAIQNARLFEETQRRTEELSVLNRVVSSASQMLDLEPALKEILRETMEISGFQGGLLSLYDETSKQLKLFTHRELPQPIWDSLHSNGFGNTLCEYVFIKKNVVALTDLRNGSPIDASGLIANGVLSYFGVPLEAKGRVIGTLCMFNNEPRQLDNRLLELARSIGIQTGFAIENARLFEATQQSEADLRALFASMQDLVMVIDQDTRYVRIAPTNPSRLFRPPQELLGQRMDEILPAETHEPFRKAIRQALEGGEAVQVEYKLSIENQDYWFLANLTRLNEKEVFWVARDITARKNNEEALQRRNEYLSATAEISQLVTSTLDMPTLFSRTVNLVCDRFGFYHAGIFVTEETGFRSILQAATGEAGAEMLRQKHSLQVGSKSVVGEVTESGRAVIVNDTAANETHKFNPLLPETRAEAAIPLHVGARTIGALDIQSTTPNAFSEDDIAVLQILADQVAIAIDNARSYELSMQAVKEMREADRLKSQFLANMSHELRTPLNSIIGFSRVILKGIDGATTDLQQQDLLAIHNSGQHLLGLINDILDLSRIEAGKMELTFDEVNLPDLITSVMSTASGLVKDKSITLHRNLPPDLPSVRADAMRIRQVLINLLSNAAKFTDEGTITVQASIVDSPTGHPEITISVIDTGPGISQEDQKKLFQPFSQVDASPTRKSGGSGLGLSISNHLIQMHGGHIGVESAPGKGSTFYFTLPAFRGKPETEAPQGKRIILAIDDDPQVISLYERYLQPQGYQVVSLSDPSRAAERVRQLKPFAVTLDIMMPGYDGWHVLNDLKSNPETRDVPVIVCSIVEEQEKGFNLGAADYLVKPILEDEILNALDRLNINGHIREVLIVDDDPNDLRLMGRMLSEQGRYHPTLAEGGRAGWESIQANMPHAVILDLFMPELDGFTILERMRSTEKLHDIPVIVVSGGGLTSEQEQQLQDFGQRMIQKSALTGKQLVEMLELTLQQVKK